MKAAGSPFPRGWPFTPLRGLGIDRLRGGEGTYRLFDHDTLPSLPALPRGFGWLAGRPDAPEWSIRGEDDSATRTLAALDRLRAVEPALPDGFVTFLGSPGLQAKLRSCTGCYLDLCPAPVEIPQGRLVRFLSDQQGCLFWYLFLAPEGDHAVVAAPDFYGTPDEEWGGEAPDPSNLLFCSESFETFLVRFWLENEIYFAHHPDDESEPLPVPAEAEAYLRDYRALEAAHADG